ncbi:hypothetical protein KPLM21_1040095 [Klebsiella pneumoniae]|nr:hypothetical protein KPLM21_1040095 [Klebsiella pneumoniae]
MTQVYLKTSRKIKFFSKPQSFYGY